MAAIMNTGFYPYIGFQVVISSQNWGNIPLPVFVTSVPTSYGLAMVPQPPVVAAPPTPPTPPTPSTQPTQPTPPTPSSNTSTTSNTAGNFHTIRIHGNESLVINNYY
ncbi:hypothetical protein HI914_02803 [Erysiphe necator]|nr:hypothetical protein HI914_02803 [Erysiphe necator]